MISSIASSFKASLAYRIQGSPQIFDFLGDETVGEATLKAARGNHDLPSFLVFVRLVPVQPQ
jgi:hypothetical protein